MNIIGSMETHLESINATSASTGESLRRAVVTVSAWFSILITGSYPEPLSRFAAGVFRWGTRVEAYVLLLRDEYPPFSLDWEP